MGQATPIPEVRLPGDDRTATEEEDEPMDVETLADLLRDAEEHHGPYEATAPPHHWSWWYAAYMVARQQGRTQEEASEDAGRYMETHRSEQQGPGS